MFQPVPQVLQHASYVPPQPAEVFAARDATGHSFDFAPLNIQIGEGQVNTFTPSGETHAQFFARIAASGLCVDESFKNPLAIVIDVNGVTFRSGARIRLSGIFAGPFFFGDQDASPAPAKTFDTRTENIRHADRALAEHLAVVDARYSDPRTVVSGHRYHVPGSTLVSLGAVAGDEITIYVVDGVDTFTIGATSTAYDFIDFVANSPTLNPGGPLTRLDCYVDQHFGNVVLVSKTRDPISVSSPGTREFKAIFGYLPA